MSQRLKKHLGLPCLALVASSLPQSISSIHLEGSELTLRRKSSNSRATIQIYQASFGTHDYLWNKSSLDSIKSTSQGIWGTVSTMYLGINLAHGSSAALISSNGQIISALEEERLSRVKNHIGFPQKAIKSLISNADHPIKGPLHVVIGNTNEYTLGQAKIAVASLQGNPSNSDGRGTPLRPGFNLGEFQADTSQEIVRKLLSKTFDDCNLSSNFEMSWVKHHNAHLGCSLGSSSTARTLLFSLDGSGDGESGALAIAENRVMERVCSINILDSLGALYSAVTQKYNFTPGKHEGKITGLAAFGKHSAAVDVLLKFVTVDNGNVRIAYSKSKWKSGLILLLKKLDIPNQMKWGIRDIIDTAANNTEDYPDLAFAVQEVLEESVLEIAQFWLTKTNTNRLSVSGGVFANVKLNQRLAERLPITELNIFPNMGDAGLSVGRVWAFLADQKKLDNGSLFKTMSLAPDVKGDLRNLHSGIDFKELPKDSLSRLAAKLISDGKFVAIHNGRMEFGPRALGSRSLLLDPRNRGILTSANARLRRTEFMPFAPVILASHFKDFFKALTPIVSYSDMTITCDVVESKKSLIPAVTHIDGTARPQVIPDDDSLYSLTIQEFYKITGIPLVVNTSFNVHEEPINFSLEDSISCLLRGAVDFVIIEEGILSLKSRLHDFDSGPQEG